jgi:hypothetical protein
MKFDVSDGEKTVEVITEQQKQGRWPTTISAIGLSGKDVGL